MYRSKIQQQLDQKLYHVFIWESNKLRQHKKNVFQNYRQVILRNSFTLYKKFYLWEQILKFFYNFLKFKKTFV